MTPVTVGMVLPPDHDTLALIAGPLRRHAGHVVITPETTWGPAPPGAHRPNGFSDRFADLQQALGVPAVAHAVGFSLGSGGEVDRRRRWLDRFALDTARYGYAWVSDHLATTEAAGRHLALPVAAPPNAGDTVAANLRALQDVVPDAGAELTATYQPTDDHALLDRALLPSRTWIVLDLHNVACMASWSGFDADAWIGRLPLDRVIEVHVSGGSVSDSSWAHGRPTRWLDSHDTHVLPVVWELLDRWARRLPHLRAITLERREGTLQPWDVAGLDADLERLRTVAAGLRPTRPEAPPLSPALPTPPPGAWEDTLAASLLDPLDEAVIDDATWYCRRLILGLRFSRLMQGTRLAAVYQADPDAFVRRFKAYIAAVPATARFPWEEARLWEAWVG